MPKDTKAAAAKEAKKLADKEAKEKAAAAKEAEDGEGEDGDKNEPRLTPEKKIEPVEEEERITSSKVEEDGPGKKSDEPEDYLIKYQVRKQTPSGTPASNPAEGTKASRMKTFLLSQPRLRMLIPRPMGEDQSVMQSVNLNGYRLDFPKDTYIDVPQQIADVLMESLKQTNAAIQINRIDGNKSKETALL